MHYHVYSQIKMLINVMKPNENQIKMTKYSKKFVFPLFKAHCDEFQRRQIISCIQAYFIDCRDHQKPFEKLSSTAELKF